MSQNLLDQLDTSVEISSRVDLGVQIILLIVIVIYAAFGFLVNKQVGILSETILTPRANLLKMLAKAHLAATLVVLLVLILALIF